MRNLLTYAPSFSSPFGARHQRVKVASVLLAATLLTAGLGLEAHAQAPAGAPGAAQELTRGGTSLVDVLQFQTGEVRSRPRLPRTGAWGIRVGQPEPSAQGAGVVLEKVGQAVIYPTTGLLRGQAGTIEFSVLVNASDGKRVLLDSWPAAGNVRIQLSLEGTKITLAFTGQDNQTKNIEGTVRWAPNTSHKVKVLWDTNELALYLDGNRTGKIDTPALAPAEPLGISLGNSREFNAPAMAAVSDLRLSTGREDRPVWAETGARVENGTPDEVALRAAQDYQSRLYPLLEVLGRQKVAEVPFAYAIAYADVGDMARALDTITPLTREVNSPLYAGAIFLRADILARQGDFNGGYEQLQVLASNRNPALAVRAQVRQAAVLFDQGNKQESLRLLGEVIAKYADLPDINEAYLMIGLDRYASGDFGAAYNALRFMGVPGAPPRQSVGIGSPLEIKVADADLNVLVTDSGLPVEVSTASGDKEKLVLRTAFSRGVYIGSLQTTSGVPKAGDGILQLIGGDKIRISYKDRLSDGAANQERVVNIGVATDSRLVAIAQTSAASFKELREYQRQNIIDDRNELLGELPKTNTSFFRNEETGELRQRGYRFDVSSFANIKVGQPVYVELTEPDEDKTAGVDKIQVELSSQAQKAMQVTLTETGPRTGIFVATVLTTAVGTPQPGALEVATNDRVVARYVDPHPAQGTRDAVRLAQVSIRTTAATMMVGLETVDENNGARLIVRVARASSSTPLSVRVDDRDMDISDAADTITVKVKSAAGEVPLKLTETGGHTGEFAAVLKLDGAVKVAPGEVITLQYVDDENPSGKPVVLEYALKVNIPEDAKVTFWRRVVKPLLPGATVRPVSAAAREEWVATTALVPGSVYRVVLNDPDLVTRPAGTVAAKVNLKTSSGFGMEIPLVSKVEMALKGFDPAVPGATYEGLFYVRLGNINSPREAFVSQTGLVSDVEREGVAGQQSMPAFSVLGTDTVQATYVEPFTAGGQKDVLRTFPLRVAGDARLTVRDMQGKELTSLKPGTRIELQIEDPDGDISTKRDTIKAVLTGSGGDKLEVTLQETDRQSGIFTASVATSAGPTAANDVLEVPFAGKLTLTYQDEETFLGASSARTLELTTAPLQEAQGLLLTKIYEDPKFELNTMLRLGESLYAVGAAEIAASGVAAGQARTNARLQDAARVLGQVTERFPSSDYVVESLFLTGKIRREEQKFEEAKALFTRVITDYPDSEFVPQALFQLVLMHFSRGDVENMTESAMRLVYGYPKNPLVAEAFLRIGEYYYGKKDYATAASIYRRALDRFPDNPKADLVQYRMATAYYRQSVAAASTSGAGQPTAEREALAQALRAYLDFVNLNPEHELADDALYWAANVALKQSNPVFAYTLLVKQLVTFPDGDMKSFAIRLRDQIKLDYPDLTTEG